jgi:hypothetical protein
MTSTHTNLRGLRTEAYANQLTGPAGGLRIGIGASTVATAIAFLWTSRPTNIVVVLHATMIRPPCLGIGFA